MAKVEMPYDYLYSFLCAQEGKSLSAELYRKTLPPNTEALDALEISMRHTVAEQSAKINELTHVHRFAVAVMMSSECRSFLMQNTQPTSFMESTYVDAKIELKELVDLLILRRDQKFKLNWIICEAIDRAVNHKV